MNQINKNIFVFNYHALKSITMHAKKNISVIDLSD